MHLSEVNTSARASITSFNDPDLELKLMEFGVAIGSQIVIQRRAPFGGPILIETQNGMIALRKEEAKTLDVDVLS